MALAAEVVADLRRVFASGRSRDQSWREAQLDGLLKLLTLESGPIESALAADLGKPPLEAFGTDIGVVRGEVADLRKHVGKWMKPRKVRLPLSSQPGSGWVVSEPYGVSLIISPWNYPVQLLVEPLASALAAGNVALVKPSEMAPATSALLADLLPRYLDDDAVRVVEGDAAVATALLEQRFDHIFFTGSTAVGRIVAQAAAKHLTPTTLELGGKSPVIVDRTADIGVAGRRIAWGKWLNAGQTCVAPDYVLCEADVRDELVSAIAAAFDRFLNGSDPAGSPDFTSIVNEHHASRLERLLTDHGGTLAYGGTVDVAGCHVAPTIVVDPAADSALLREEIFGPVLVVRTVGSLDAALDVVNAGEKPLALYVFSGDDQIADHIIEQTSAGGTVVNHVMLHCGPSELPFGGVGESGQGRYHGRAGFDEFSNQRSVLRKPTRIDPPLLYPPYTAKKERLIRRFL